MNESLPTVENDALPVGPIVDDACARYGDCKRPRAEHRENFMDLRDGVIDHDFMEPQPRPYDHERVPAMITTEWRCHSCGADNDVWGTGATEGYMECGSCGAWSWLDFNPDGYEAQTEALCPRVTPPAVRDTDSAGEVVSGRAVDSVVGLEAESGPSPAGPVCPECVQGKHQNCRGDAWDDEADAPIACTCPDGSHR